MFDRKSLSAADISVLMMIDLSEVQKANDRLANQLRRHLGEEPLAVPPPGLEKVVRVFQEALAGLMARRLKRNRRTTLLFSPRDLDPLIASSLELLEESEGELEPQQKQALQTLMRSLFRGIFSQMQSLSIRKKDPYAARWRWLALVHELARQGGVSPRKLLSTRSGRDALQRHQTKREQFLAHGQEVIDTFTDIEAQKKSILEPIIQALAQEESLTKAEVQEVRDEIERELVPKLSDRMVKVKLFLERWYAKEAARIYGQSE